VDWYEFSLDRTAQVTLTTTPPQQSGTGFQGVLSLYNSDSSDLNDPNDPLGHRLLVQGDGGGAGGDDTITRLLGPGTYDVAVSGAGNTDFNPFIAGSGYPGTTGSYDLQLSAVAAGPGPGDGPVVLTSDPAPSAVIDASPLVIRLDLSGSLDPSTILPGQTVQLIFNPSGTFGDGNDRSVPLAGTNFSSSINELQLTPEAPLAPGYYKVELAGNTIAGQAVLTAPNSQPLGKNPSHPLGQDFSTTFQVDGIDGVKGAVTSDDTPATARNLGNVTNTGIVQASGAIGVDPYYNPSNPDSSASNPANQVDLYHFSISGPGRYAFVAEVFAGRIGSPLTPGLTLYKVDPTDNTLQFVDGNTGTLNPTSIASADPGSLDPTPLFSDPALFEGLTKGDYYLAVSDSMNAITPLDNLDQSSAGLYDPNVSHSAALGVSTGSYVLNLMVQPDSDPPQVVATSPAAGVTLNQPPTQLTVQFNEAINVQILNDQATKTSLANSVPQNFIPAVYVQGADGTKYYPEFVSFDYQTDQATFRMADELTSGSYQLHLSGPNGLVDLGGNALTGNSPGGDYVVSFTVNSPADGQGSNPLQRVDQEPNNSPASAQDLGTLFEHQLGPGIVVTRDFRADPADAPSDTADVYRFQTLESLTLWFKLKGPAQGANTVLKLLGPDGNPVPVSSFFHGKFLEAALKPGSYMISVSGWTSDQASGIAYQLRISSPYSFSNPVPLVSGPAPALSFHLDGAPTPSVDPPPPVVISVPASVPTAAPSPQPTVTTAAPSSVTVAGPSALPITPTTTPSAVSLVVTSAGHATPGDLVVLGFGPVGGVTGANVSVSTASVQVALQEVAAPIAQSVVGLVTLTQRLEDGGELLRVPLVLSHVSAPMASPIVAETAEPFSVALPRNDLSTIPFVVEADQGGTAPSTSRGSERPIEVASADGEVTAIDADSSRIADQVAEAPSEPSFALDLAGLPWTSALAVIAAAALTYVAKGRLARRLGLGQRPGQVSRNIVTLLRGYHAMTPRRSSLARRRRRDASIANRA
jgi:hypothetical protein